MLFNILLLVTALISGCLSSISPDSSVCNQGLYVLAGPLADYPPAQSFCTAHFPPSTVTVTVGAKVAVKRTYKTTTTTSTPSKTSPTTKAAATTTTTSAMRAVTTTSSTTTKSSTTLTTTTKRSTTTTQDSHASLWSSLSSVLSASLSTLCSCIEQHPTTTITSSTTTTSTTTKPSTTSSSTTTKSPTTSSSTTTSSTTTPITTTSSTTTASTTTSSSTTSSSTTTQAISCPTYAPDVCTPGTYYKPIGTYNAYQIICGYSYTADAANSVTVPAANFNECFQACNELLCYFDGVSTCLIITGQEYSTGFDASSPGGVIDATDNTCTS